MGTVIGSELLAQALKSQGVDTMFYVMGGPMLETEATCIKLGIRAIDTRHEQAAALAAHAWGRVMRRPEALRSSCSTSLPRVVTWIGNSARFRRLGNHNRRLRASATRFRRTYVLASPACLRQRVRRLRST